MSLAVRKIEEPMMPLASSSTESKSVRPRTRVGFTSDFAGCCDRTGISMALSHPQFVRRFERSATAAADDGGAIATGQRIGDLNRALRTVEKFRLGFGRRLRIWSHEEGKCSIDVALPSRRLQWRPGVPPGWTGEEARPPSQIYKGRSMPDKTPPADETLQNEFNRWAEEGEGEKMERHHLDITAKTIRLMDLRPGERVLDLGCGAGWATRLLARLVADGPEGFGQVVGIDVSDEMIRRARTASKDFENILYVWGSAQQIPWEENFFDKMLSVESFYYYADQERALAELFRVMAPRGRMFILINLYKDNPYSLQWVDKLKVPVHVRSEAEYIELLKRHAFQNVEARQIPDDTPTPDDYVTKSFHSLNDLKAFKRTGALLLTASKPDPRTPAPHYLASTLAGCIFSVPRATCHGADRR